MWEEWPRLHEPPNCWKMLPSLEVPPVWAWGGDVVVPEPFFWVFFFMLLFFYFQSPQTFGKQATDVVSLLELWLNP